MGLRILAFIGLGVVCAVLANLPALLSRENVAGVTLSNRRLIMMLAAQAFLFAGYGLLVSVMRRQSAIDSLTRAVILGLVFGVIPIFLGGRVSRPKLIRSIPLAVAIAACTVVAFVMGPMVPGD